MRLECIHDLFLISFAGLPPTTDISVVFLATTALAPTTVPYAIKVQEGNITESGQSQT